MKIAIIEDDFKISEELSKLLKGNGYDPFICLGYSISELEKLGPDLILLDVNLPNQSGFDLCKEIRKKMNTPIVFVTCRNTDEDELKSILSGGSDFIRKPYHCHILLEKIKRALEMNHPSHCRELIVGDIRLDVHLSILKYQEKEVELTRNEFRILYYLFLNKGRIVTKDELIEYLWNDKYYLDENILIVNINRLRKKAKEIGIYQFIETARGVGYRV